MLADPSVLEGARRRVDGWLESGGAHRRYAQRWREILSRSPAEIAAFLVDRGELADTLRSVSPFAGVLDPRERWRILRGLGR